MNGFGKRLAERRKHMKLNQEKLAEIIGIGRGSIGNYEKEENMPSVEVLIKLSKVLNVSTDFLLFGTGGEDSEEVSNLKDKQIAYMQKLIDNYETQLRDIQKGLDEYLAM